MTEYSKGVGSWDDGMDGDDLPESTTDITLRSNYVPDENYLMTFGKHKGKRLADVPVEYLKWLREQGSIIDVRVRMYIEKMGI